MTRRHCGTKLPGMSSIGRALYYHVSSMAISLNQSDGNAARGSRWCGREKLRVNVDAIASHSGRGRLCPDRRRDSPAAMVIPLSRESGRPRAPASAV